MRCKLLGPPIAVAAFLIGSTPAFAEPAETIYFDSHCPWPLRLLVLREGLNGELKATGWYEVPAGSVERGSEVELRRDATDAPLTHDPSKPFYLYAESSSGPRLVWDGSKTAPFGNSQYGFRKIGLDRHGRSSRLLAWLRCDAALRATTNGAATSATASNSRPAISPQGSEQGTGPVVVFFGGGEDALAAAAKSTLDQFAAKAIASQGLVRVEGHTDTFGDAQENVYLSQRRAKAVRDYLISRGVMAGVVTTEAYGESRPKRTPSEGVRERRNDRVEITLLPPRGW